MSSYYSERPNNDALGWLIGGVVIAAFSVCIHVTSNWVDPGIIWGLLGGYTASFIMIAVGIVKRISSESWKPYDMFGSDDYDSAESKS